MQYVCLFADPSAGDLESLINLVVDQASHKVRLSFQGFNTNVCQVELLEKFWFSLSSSQKKLTKIFSHTNTHDLILIYNGLEKPLGTCLHRGTASIRIKVHHATKHLLSGFLITKGYIKQCSTLVQPLKSNKIKTSIFSNNCITAGRRA